MKRVIVVTGISSGIGEALVELFGREFPDSKIIALSRGAKINTLPGNVRLIKVDLTKTNRLGRIVKDIENRYGGIDVLINNAGNGTRGSIEDTTIAEVGDQLALNLWPVLRLIQLVLPGMRNRRAGHIINVSSMAANIDYPTLGYYGATKAFIEKVSRTLALEVAPWNITVSVVEPGAVKTKFGGSMTNVKKYGRGPYASMYQTWEARFARMFKHPNTSEQAARVIAKLIKKPRSLAFLRGKDRLAYLVNHYSRQLFNRLYVKLYIR